MFLTFTF